MKYTYNVIIITMLKKYEFSFTNSDMQEIPFFKTMNLFSVLALFLCGHRKLIPDIAVVLQKGLFRAKIWVKRHLALNFVLLSVLVS